MACSPPTTFCGIHPLQSKLHNGPVNVKAQIFWVIKCHPVSYPSKTIKLSKTVDWIFYWLSGILNQSMRMIDTEMLIEALPVVKYGGSWAGSDSSGSSRGNRPEWPHRTVRYREPDARSPSPWITSHRLHSPAEILNILHVPFIFYIL